VDQLDVLRFAIDALERSNFPYALVGAFASFAYGEPRFTRDIDFVVKLEPRDVALLVAAFPEPDFEMSETVVQESVRRGEEFSVIHPTSGNKIDFIPTRNDAWGRGQVERRVRLKLIPDREAFVASPDDVIVGKPLYFAEGGSEKHLRDIAGILKVSPERVDRAEVTRWATELGVVETWKRVVAAVDAPRS